MKDYLQRFDALTFRERLIVGLLLLLIPLYIWYVYLYEPLIKEQQSLASRTELIRNDNIELKGKIAQMQAQVKKDPNLANKKQIESLTASLHSTREEILQSTSNLIKPEQMPEILRSMLTQSRGLTLTSMNGLGKSQLIEPAEEDEPEQDESNEFINAYKHGLKISFRANFSDTVAFIKKLESLSSGFFWSSYDFSVEEYPVSSSEITLYTLSLDENWIEI